MSSTTETASLARERARPMAPEDRREALVRAAIPLLRERGRQVSTKELAEACGVAEGTLFRAFGDKESLITAAVEAYFDPRPFRLAIASIDRDLPADRKIAAVIVLLRERFTGAIGFMSALGLRGGPPASVRRLDTTWIDAFEELLQPDVDRLSAAPRTVARFLRMLALSSAMPHPAEAETLDTEELVRLVTGGVLAPRTEG